VSPSSSATTSWHDATVFARLRDSNKALCISDTDEKTTPLEITADYAYFRLRDEGYGQADIEKWAETITETTGDCKDVFVYFKHEESGKGPEFANTLRRALPAL
jgi:uncharacterized protein YecE (DUF72 family)